LIRLTEYVSTQSDKVEGQINERCNFSDIKVFVQGPTKDGQVLSNFNLDRFQDIQRILGIGLMTQTRNQWDEDKGNEDFVIKDFTPLYSCNDDYHTDRVKNFIGNRWRKDRSENPSRTPVNNTPKNLAEKYK